MAFSPITFGREAFDELKKVTWPTRADVQRLTIAVLGISFLVGLFLSAFDLGLERIINTLINR